MNGSNPYDQEEYIFILPALPIRGMPVSQDKLEKIKSVCNHTILLILQSGKNNKFHAGMSSNIHLFLS